MSVIDLETILLPEDIASQASVHCLACRRRLGSVCYVDREAPNGDPQTAVSVSLLPEMVKDFRQGGEHVALVCRCGRKSTFHLL